MSLTAINHKPNILYLLDHDIELRQEYASDMQGTLESHLIVNADEFYISIQDIPTHLNRKKRY